MQVNLKTTEAFYLGPLLLSNEKFELNFPKKNILKRPFVGRWNSLVSGGERERDNDFHHQRVLNSCELFKGIAAHVFLVVFKEEEGKG